MNGLAVHVLGNGDANLWKEAVASLPGADASHDWRWGEVLEAAYGWRPERVVWRRSEGWAAAVQFHVFPHRLRRIGISSPFLTTGGLLAGADVSLDCCRRDLGRIAGTMGLRHVDLREVGAGGGGGCDEEFTFRLRLRSRAELMDSFPSKLRSQIRKPQKDGYSAGPVDGSALVFYEQFRRRMHAFGTPVHASRLFSEWLARMPDVCRQFVVRDPDGEVVGGMLMAVAHGVASIPFAVVHEPQRRSAANMLLYWEALAGAADAGCAVVDFGRSRKGSGTWEFKRQWGGEALPLVNRRCAPSGCVTAGFGLRGAWAERFTSAWSRLPAWLADAMGPGVRRFIP